MTPFGAAFALDGLLRRAAEREPDHLAVMAPDASLTYAELEQGAARTASALRDLGVRAGDRVAIWAPKSWRSVVTIYGAMRACAAYVPIDPLTPRARALKVLESADCRVLCADGARLQQLSRAMDDRGTQTINLGADSVAATLAFDELDRFDSDVSPSACESDLAYILYTSGSTGTPKGVMLTHRNALSFVEWTVDRFGVCATDRLVSHAPFHFDLSVFDLYASAMTGASVHILAPGEESMGADMAAAIRSRALTVWYSVPSALILLCGVAGSDDLSSLTTVLFAGEVFPMKYLRRLRELVPDAVLANLYGPTEANVCTYFTVGRELPPGDDPLPIGRACENQAVFALDDQLRLVREGEIGELWVRGPTVMKGYWDNPQETRKRLRQNPLHDRYPDPAYRTGDLVRRLPGGEHAFIGRRDHQIKSRGYRIELGDIEAVLTSHPRVREAAVVAVPDERIGSLLVGFVSGDAELEVNELRRHCADALPRYMIPASIVVEASLPRGSTGKLDRQELGRRAAGYPSGDRAEH
jgi:amino acid adenylation domain-containing protein